MIKKTAFDSVGQILIGFAIFDSIYGAWFPPFHFAPAPRDDFGWWRIVVVYLLSIYTIGAIYCITERSPGKFFDSAVRGWGPALRAILHREPKVSEKMGCAGLFFFITSIFMFYMCFGGRPAFLVSLGLVFLLTNRMDSGSAPRDIAADQGSGPGLLSDDSAEVPGDLPESQDGE